MRIYLFSRVLILAATAARVISLTGTWWVGPVDKWGVSHQIDTRQWT